MSATIVTTQQELDDAIAAGTAEIEIRSPRGVWLNIGDTRDSDVTVAGESYVDEVSGRVGRVVGSGSVGRVVGSGSVEWVGDSGSVEWVGDSGSVGRVGDSGSVGRVGGSGSVGRVGGSGRVEWVGGSGRVGRVGGSGSVGHASGTATVHLHDQARLDTAGSNVAVFLHSSRATFNGGHLIDLTQLNLADTATWASHHAVDIADGHLTVYKAVRDDLTSAHGFAYPIGDTVACDDWRDDSECGHGLHFSPTPGEAREYDEQATRYLECRIAVADVRALDNISSAAKCKTPRALVVREVDLSGRPTAPAEVTA